MTFDPARAKSLFLAASDLPDRAERAVYLDRECGADAELRARVEALLRADEPSPVPPAGDTEAFVPSDLGTVDPPSDTSPTGTFGPEAHRPNSRGTGDFAPDGATGTFGGTPARDGRCVVPELGTVIAGRYTLVEVIGEGGMGSVYLAGQTEPVKRRVALKLIKAGMDSKAVLARFDAERQALALMDHPNIARIYDGGVTPAGQPFFVMELVKGVPLTDYCDARRLTVAARLQLFVAVCQAVQHAHQKGIIHRDLKPGNVLVTEVDGRPTPKVIDFGVAKATELKLTDLSFADTGAIVGTPAYMSPEQADPSSMDIDTRTDVYALGVILYELLTGAPPIDSKRFKRGAILEMLRMVREVDPPRPSTRLSEAAARPNIAASRSTEPAKLAKLLRGELDWVVMKALEKDRTRRYDTANGFAADILRYLADEVVEARPPSAGYRLRKFVRRNKGQVLAASLVLVALLGGIAGTTFGLIEARRQEQEAKKQEQIARDEAAEKEAARLAEARRVTERDEAIKDKDARAQERDKANDELKHRLGVSDMVLAGAAYNSGDLGLATQRLEKVPPEQRGWEWRYLKQQTRGGIFTVLAHGSQVRCVAISPDGTRIVSAAGGPRSDTVEVKVWDARTGEARFELKPLRPDQRAGMLIGDVAFSPDSKWIVSGGEGNSARVCDATTGEVRLELKGHTSPVICASYAPGGTRIATGSTNGELKLWDARTGTELFGLKAHAIHVFKVGFSPDGTRIITGGRGGHPERNEVKLWNAEKEGNALLELNVTSTEQNVASFSPDGTRIIVGGGDRVTVRDARSGAVLFELRARYRAGAGLSVGSDGTTGSGVQSASFSPDGMRIVTAGGTGDSPGTVVVWNARTGEELRELKGHTALVISAAFNPDGTQIVTGCADGTMKLWDAQAEGSRLEIGVHSGGGGTCLAISPDGKLIAGGRLDGTTTVWEVPSARPEGVARQRTVRFTLKGDKGPVWGVAFNGDGTRIATGGGGDGKPGHVTVWNAQTGEPVLDLTGLKEKVQSVAFNRDGTRIATGGLVLYGEEDGASEVKVWDAQTGMILLDLTETRPQIGAGNRFDATGWNVVFSPDGNRLLAGRSTDHGGGRAWVKVWDAQTGKPLVEGKGPKKAFEGRFIAFPGAGDMRIVFSPDGKQLVACAGNHQIARVYDAVSGKLQLELTGHQGGVMDAAFSPDGKRIVTGCADGTVRVWDVRTGLALVEWRGQTDGYTTDVKSVAFTPDGTRIVTAGWGNVYVWDAGIGKESPEEELAYRRTHTAPSYGQYRNNYLAAQAVKDDFAAKFYLDLLIELSASANKPDEVKKWRAERAKYPDVAPPPHEKK